MKIQTGYITGQKGLRLFYRSWLPDHEFKAIIIVVHGIAEHSGRYAVLAQYLVSHGYAVFAMDHRHHGQSEGIPGQVDNFQFFIDDLNSFFQKIAHENTDHKTFILGHSMGATISLASALNFQLQPAGFIISGAPFRANPSLPAPVIALLRPLGYFCPNLGLFKLNSSLLSKDSAVVESYDLDPLVFRGKITARLGIELLWQSRRLENELACVKAPILILHGREDTVCISSGAQILSQNVSSSEKRLIFYPGLYHEILNEPEREKVFVDIVWWLKTRLE